MRRGSASRSSKWRTQAARPPAGSLQQRGAAAVIFPQPNFFGCLSRAPALAAAAREAGALAVAHVDLTSLGVLEAPGAYGCDIAVGEGPGVGNPPSYGARTTASRRATEFIRRMPGRIVGQTTDLDGDRGFVLTLQTREQHIRREKATSNMTTNQTLLALGGLVTLAWLGPEGLRELGETCMSLAAYARQRIALPRRSTGRCSRSSRAANARPARDVIREARALGVHPGLRARPRLRGDGRRAPRRGDEKRAPADIDRLADVLAEVCG